METMKKKVYLGSDHGGFELKNTLAAHLREQGWETEDLGCYSAESCDYPDFAAAVGRAVAANEGTLGLLVCGTGIGMSLAANKIPGVRAAVCGDVYSAKMTRRHNDANVLCLGARVVGEGLAWELVTAFVTSGFEGGKHARRIGLIADLENRE